ncbi:hypothetical protein MTO96_036019 [Rhipicephalus appendiculatus]
MKRLRTLKVDLLGATPHDELTYARNEKYFGKPRQAAALLEEVPGRDLNYGGDFFPGSAFSTEPKYVPETHTLYLPPAMFGLIDKVQEFDDPLLMVPLIGAPVLKAMLAVIDGRGTQTFIRDSSVSTHWWSPADDSKLTKIKSCYRDLYALSLKDMLINSNHQAFFEEFIAQGALLEPPAEVLQGEGVQVPSRRASDRTGVHGLTCSSTSCTRWACANRGVPNVTR